MKDANPQSGEISPIDTALMVKRLFKVAELLARYTPQIQDFHAKKEGEKRDFQETEYGMAEDQKHK